jgi:ParB-like chromosome segregation protein Spo0J
MIHVPLERIQPNPWQTRQVLDEIHVRDLAADIASRKASRRETLGLLQVPAGRLVDADGQPLSLDGSEQALSRRIHEDGYRVQLAYGHSRAEAFRLLAQGDGEGFAADPDYGSLPLEIVAFDDEEMATAAWTENATRKDLTPIEEARAIHHMMESFSWTQGQVAKRLGLNRSTVANKLRLLRLPDPVQEAVLKREITERQAVALIPVLDLPESALARVERHWGEKPQDLIEAARSGVSSGDLRVRAGRVVVQSTRSFTLGNGAPFPLDHYFELDDEQALQVEAHRCEDCLIRVKHEGELRCPDEKCWDLKAELWADLRLADAEAASGLPRLVDDGKYGTVETFYALDNTALAAEIAKEGCPRERLRLKFEHAPRAGALLDGFDDVRVVCHHGEGDRCHCLAAKKSALTRERNQSDPELQARRQREKKVRELTAPAYQVLAKALVAGHVGAWRLLLKRLNSAYGGRSKDWELDKIALKVATEAMSAELAWHKDRPDRAQSVIVRYFEEVGLELPWPPPDPADEIQHRLDRIGKWFDDCKHNTPTVAALNGNRTNLERLAGEAEALPPDGRKQALAAQIAQRRDQLEDIAEILAEWDDVKDGGEWTRHGSRLVTIPPGDVNFKDHIEQVTRPAVIRYAAALAGNGVGQKTRLKSFSYRLRLLEKPND